MISLLEEKDLEQDEVNKYLSDVEIIFFISQMPCGVIDKFEGSTLSPDWKGTRRKPGRGERTSKNSCADKLCKWFCIGLQGRRLYNLLGKLPFQSLVIGNCSEECDFNLEKVNERINNETKLIPCSSSKEEIRKRVKLNPLSIRFAKNFKHEQLTRTSERKPFPVSVVAWIDEKTGSLKVEKLVDGRKEGTTISNYNKNNLSSVSSAYINQRLDQIKCPVKSEEYSSQWQQLLENERFTGWKEIKLTN